MWHGAGHQGLPPRKRCRQGSHRADCGLGFSRTREEQLMTNTNKKRYSKPRITPEGSVDKITLEQDKTWGGSDGFTLDQVPIQNAS